MRQKRTDRESARQEAEKQVQDGGLAETHVKPDAAHKTGGAEDEERKPAEQKQTEEKAAEQRRTKQNEVPSPGEWIKKDAALFRREDYRLSSLRRANRRELWQRYLRARSYAVEHAKQPHLELKTHEESGRRVFADGCGFYKLFWIFVLGSFFGDIVETLWCRFRLGEWMSRSSLVFGQFSIVWGLGCFLLTFFLHRLIDKDDRYIFFAGTVLGGAFEYMCSVFTEKVFGCVFWDYSKMTFNLNGRINLLYCFFWGIIAIVWLKVLYPWMSKLIERIPIRLGKVLTWAAVVFFAVNICISTAALYRMHTRSEGVPASNWAERYVDAHFTDEWIQKRYQNLKLVE